jgi:hypothetical protein
MSTLKTNNLQHLDSGSANIELSIGGGVIHSGISTFQSGVRVTDGVQVGTGATINGTTNTITALTNGSEVVRITSSGSIGIGTTNPSSTGNNYGSLDISGSSGGEIFLSDDGTAKGNLFNYSADTNLVGLAAVNASGQLLFSTGGYNERLRITSDGKVGIGTTDPQTNLELFTDDDTDNSSDTGTNNQNSILRLFNKNGTDNTAVNNYVGIRFDVANGATSSAWLDYVRTGNNQGAFLFKARNTASSFPELMRINSDGNIGIGTDTATNRARLDLRQASGHPAFNIGFPDGSFYRNLGAVGPYDSDGATPTNNKKYLHVRLRTVWNDESMTLFRVTGYFSYSSYAESYVGMYRYNNNGYRTNPYGPIISNQGNKAVIHSIYNTTADPGYLVIVCDWSTHYAGLMIEHIGAGGQYANRMQQDLEIIDTKRSTVTTAQW